MGVCGPVATSSTGAIPESRRVRRRPDPAVPAGGAFQRGDVTPRSGDVPDCGASHQQVHLPADRCAAAAADELLDDNTHHASAGRGENLAIHSL